MTFGQTSQLILEIRIICGIIYWNYVIPLTALENHVFSPFEPFSALIRPSSGKKRIESWTFGQTSQLKLEIRLTVVVVERNYVIPLMALETMFSYRL